MKFTGLLCCVVLLVTTNLSAQSVNTVIVPPGDTQALINAVDQANRVPVGEWTIVKVSGKYQFTDDDFFPPIIRNISISGYSDGPALFDAGTTTNSITHDVTLRGPDQLFKIEEDAHLIISHLDFSDFALKSSNPLIENLGILELKFVQFRHMVDSGFATGLFPSPISPLIGNEGELTANGVSFIDVGWFQIQNPASIPILDNKAHAVLRNIQVSYTIPDVYGQFFNYGSLSILNSTFVNNPKYSWESAIHTFPESSTHPEGHTQVGNSVFVGYDGVWCSTAQSLGHNAHTPSGCDFNADGDIVGADSTMIRQKIVAVGWHGATTHHLVLAPSPNGVLIDSADPTWCPESDLLGQSRYIDGDGDGEAACDRGAVEFSDTVLQNGGISGYYFNSASDGHYIHVLDNPYNVLITWETFDRLGNQAWIYATGQLQEEGVLEADAYINPEGFLTDEGPMEINRAEKWGKIKVQFESCRKGHFWFESQSPYFGSGDFQFERLAYVKQLGCTD